MAYAEQWFKEEKADTKISQKIDLERCLFVLLLFYLKDKKQAFAMLKQQNYKKEHLNYLERLHTLCGKKSSLKIASEKIFLARNSEKRNAKSIVYYIRRKEIGII